MTNPNTTPTEIEDILSELVQKTLANVVAGGDTKDMFGAVNGSMKVLEEATAALKDRESRLIQKHNAMLQHVGRLRHAVNVGHWNSTCGNCHQNLLAKDEPKNCPRCNFALSYFTTDYPDEVEAARKVFPYLEYFPKYDLTEWESATLSKEGGGE
jgi:hypothetical protein